VSEQVMRARRRPPGSAALLRRWLLAARGIVQDPLATAHIPVRCSQPTGAGPPAWLGAT